MRRLGVMLLALLAAAGSVADTRALVVAGLGGTGDYETAFQRQAKAVADAVRDVANDVTLLLGGMVSSQRLAQELQALTGRTAQSDTVLVVLIGHGSFDDRDYRFNLPGPDVTGTELARWLADVPAARQLVIAATSASGALQDLLAADGRAVVTATRSGGEGNAIVFARYLSEALGVPAADTDKDGFIGADEAFGYADARVATYYRDRQEMATEHPTRSGPELELALARVPGAARPAVSDVGGGRLEELESAIDALRARKGELAPDAYYAELQRLLLELAMARGTSVSGEQP